MSLKELTKVSHSAAEKTLFMKAVFKGTLPLHLWADFLYQKSLVYNAIESCAIDLGLIADIPELKRAFYLLEDARACSLNHELRYQRTSIDYYEYIMSLYPDPNKIMSHLYVWHMGDLYGGQMIKKTMIAPCSHLTFNDPQAIAGLLRTKTNDDMANEAINAFNWAIRMMEEYDDQFSV